MRRIFSGAGVIAAGAALVVGLGSSPAAAATTSWAGNDSSASDIVGVHGWGEVTYDSEWVNIYYNVKDTKADGHGARLWVRICNPDRCVYDDTYDRTGSADSLYGSDMWGKYRWDVTSIAVQECLTEGTTDYDCAPGWQRVY
ncbi:hypothetical protein [Streptomyces sp. NPDC059781]|uniref:hypothetical protein n=1 Tax=Streptomyces sp. NPDC059781 TaxID=3346943 RepID=UPI00364C73E7